MNQQQYYGQINLLKNLDDIDENFNEYDKDEVEEDFDDFLECFSDEDDDSDQEQSKFCKFPSFQNIQGSQQFTTFQDLEISHKKQTEHVLLQPGGDEQYPNFDNHDHDDDEEVSDLFDSFEMKSENKKPDDKTVNYIEIKYFDEIFKIPILSSRLFQPQQPIEDRLMFENTELILNKLQMHDFYEHIQKILKQDSNKLNDNLFSTIVLDIQNKILQNLSEFFEKMQDIQQKWQKMSPSIICDNYVKLFTLQCKSLQDSIKYVLDANTNKLTSRRYFDNLKPAYFQSPNQEKQKEKQTEDEIVLELQQIPFNQNFYPKSSLVSILHFKATILKELYFQFLHYKSNTDTYKEKVRKRLLKLKNSFFIKNKFLQNHLKYVHTPKMHHKTIIEQDEVDIYWGDYRKFSKMKCFGLSKALTDQMEYLKTFNHYQQQRNQKFLSAQYLQYNQQEFI